MGIEDHTRNPGAAPIVAFDFDGTLTVRDSFAAFLAWRAGPTRLALGLARLAPAAARYALDHDRRRFKAAATQEFLSELTPATLQMEAERFADQVFTRLMRPDALATWSRWRAEGARCVIVTASPELIVTPFGRRLGAEAVLGTRLAIDASGRLTGAIAGPNCRGPEKVVRLLEALGPQVRLAAAYGDTAGDREMLAIAEVAGMKVFRARP
jgi:phosphatidylglycerophosphatase C